MNKYNENSKFIMKACIVIALICIGILFFTVAPVKAGESEPELVSTQYRLPGETDDAFALRIVPAVADVTRAKNAEVCGEFQADKIVLYTIYRQKECSYTRLAGQAYNGVSFHTHIRTAPSNFSDADLGYPGYMAWGRQLKHLDANGNVRKVVRQ